MLMIISSYNIYYWILTKIERNLDIATDTQMNADQMMMMMLMIMIMKLLFSTTQSWPSVNDSSVMNIYNYNIYAVILIRIIIRLPWDLTQCRQ